MVAISKSYCPIFPQGTRLTEIALRGGRMKTQMLCLVVGLLLSDLAVASPGGSAELIDGRLKIQLNMQKELSQGSYQLRSILQQAGFKNDDGFVRTGQTLAPLEIYNNLYDDGKYVFTINLPVDDKTLFVSYDAKGFVSFGGLAAQKLFELLKLYVTRNDVNNLEQYKWTNTSYCDKSKTGTLEYRCWIDL